MSIYPRPPELSEYPKWSRIVCSLAVTPAALVMTFWTRLIPGRFMTAILIALVGAVLLQSGFEGYAKKTLAFVLALIGFACVMIVAFGLHEAAHG